MTSPKLADFAFALSTVSVPLSLPSSPFRFSVPRCPSRPLWPSGLPSLPVQPSRSRPLSGSVPLLPPRPGSISEPELTSCAPPRSLSQSYAIPPGATPSPLSSTSTIPPAGAKAPLQARVVPTVVGNQAPGTKAPVVPVIPPSSEVIVEEPVVVSRPPPGGGRGGGSYKGKAGWILFTV